MKNFLSAIAAAIALASVPALAVSTHSKTVTNVVSVVITNAEHGMNSKYFGVHLYDTSSVRFQPAGIVGYTYSIHPADFTVTVSLSNSFSGTVRLTGPFTGPTSHSRDFAVSTGVDAVSGNGLMQVCASCTSTDFALRSWGGKSWYSAGPETLTLTAMGGMGIWRAWLENQKVVFGFPWTRVARADTGGRGAAPVRRLSWAWACPRRVLRPNPCG